MRSLLIKRECHGIIVNKVTKHEICKRGGGLNCSVKIDKNKKTFGAI